MAWIASNKMRYNFLLGRKRGEKEEKLCKYFGSIKGFNGCYNGGVGGYMGVMKRAALPQSPGVEEKDCLARACSQFTMMYKKWDSWASRVN